MAIAYAREGADLLISYLDEHEDAQETKRLVEAAGRKAVLMAGDIQDSAHCRKIVDKAVSELGGIDILVNNAAHQASFKDIAEISDEEWELTFKVNIHAVFYLTKAAVPHMKPGSAIINTASINSDVPNPSLLAYATTKGAIQNFTAGLAQLLAEKGIRANAVAPGPIWTPLIPSTLPEDWVSEFRQERADEAPRPTGRACHRLRHAGRSAVELRLGRDHRRNRRQADPLAKLALAILVLPPLRPAPVGTIGLVLSLPPSVRCSSVAMAEFRRRTARRDTRLARQREVFQIRSTAKATLPRATTLRMNGHAEDDGFPPQEDPSQTASDTRARAAGEKGSETGTKERQGLTVRRSLFPGRPPLVFPLSLPT